MPASSLSKENYRKDLPGDEAIPEKTGVGVDNACSAVDEVFDAARNDSRRNFALGLASLGVGAMLNCVNLPVYDVRKIYQNFKINDYAPIKAGERKEWTDEVSYNNQILEDALGKQLEGYSIKLPFGRLFNACYAGREIQLNPLTQDKERMISIIEAFGYHVERMHIEFREKGFYLSVNCHSPAAYIRVLFENGGMAITGTDDDNMEKTIRVIDPNDGRGIRLAQVKKKPGTSAEVSGVSYFANTGERCDIAQIAGTIYTDSNGDTFPVRDVTSLIGFLKRCESPGLLEFFLTSQDKAKKKGSDIVECGIETFNFSGLNVKQLRKIFALLPVSPLMLTKFLNFALRYSNSDRGAKDEFRHPAEVLRSGWGDCDDFAVINGFWAHLNGYSPHLVFIIKKDSKGHVFIWYENEKGKMVVLDNSQYREMEKGVNINQYVASVFPGYKMKLDKAI